MPDFDVITMVRRTASGFEAKPSRVLDQPRYAFGRRRIGHSALVGGNQARPH